MAEKKTKDVLSVEDLAKLKDPHNARRHTPEGQEALANSFRAFGAGRSIVMDAEGVIRAGNGSVDGAAAAGIKGARIIETDGSELIVVKRTDLSGERAVAYGIADNKTGELSDWDPEALRGAMESIGAEEFRAATGFSAEEIKRLDRSAPRGCVDEAPEVPEVAVTQPGDLWVLGDHRLLCGDSRVPVNVDRLLDGNAPGLMVTDPPYGVNYDPSWRNEAGVSKSSRTGVVLNDDIADWTPTWRLFPGNVVYVWHGGLHSATVQLSLQDAGFNVRAQIVWVKPRLVLSRGHYHWQHEPCFVGENGAADVEQEVVAPPEDRECEEAWYAVRKGASSYWVGGRKQSTVWDIGFHEDAKTIHGTQKPVECMARPIRNHEGLDVYEPFCGSGTTLIAAEQLGRRCFAMELSPEYCDVIVQRWENLTGRKAKLESAK